MFLVTEPLRGWRQVLASDRRTRLDFAHWIKELADVHYPTAERLVLGLDQLTTHSPTAFDDACPPAEARRLTDRVEIHDTPNHGSWPNRAEIELSALQRQCLNRRLGDRAAREREVAAWGTARNTDGAAVDWRFTTPDARIKPKRLYPVLHA